MQESRLTCGGRERVTARATLGRTSMDRKRTSCALLKRPISTEPLMMAGRVSNVLNHS